MKTGKSPWLVTGGIPDTIRRLGRVGSRYGDEIAAERMAHGGDIVRLYGEPKRPLPEHVLAAAYQAMQEGMGASSTGLLSLRRAIAERTKRDTGQSVDPDTQVIVTNGAMQALHVIMTTLLEPGDEVVIPSPCFCYGGLVDLQRGRAVYVPMRQEEDFRWDLERIEAAISERTKLLIVNTPVNPTGRVLSHGELHDIAGLAVRHPNLVILADEAYDTLVYDGRRHESLYGFEGMQERTLLVQSATKSYAMGAWRVGWIVAPPSFATLFTKVMEWMVLACNHVAQAAVAAAIAGPQDWLEDIPTEFQAKRDRAVDALKAIGDLPFVRPQGGPFLFPNVSALQVSGDTFADHLVRDWGLRITGGSFYNSPEHIRIPFGGTHSAIEETFRRLDRAVRGLRERGGRT